MPCCLAPKTLCVLVNWWYSILNASFKRTNVIALKHIKYNIISYSPSKVTIAGLEDNDYYNILISLTFNEEIEGLNSTVNVTVVRVEDRYYVCGLDNA